MIFTHCFCKSEGIKFSKNKKSVPNFHVDRENSFILKGHWLFKTLAIVVCKNY